MKLKILLSGLGIFLLLIIVAALVYRSEKKAVARISNFEECVENGFPVQESYPRRCLTPDGRVFTEDVVFTEPSPAEPVLPDETATTTNVFENATTTTFDGPDSVFTGAGA